MYSNENHATGGAHAYAPPGTIIANKYKVISDAGTGNFAKVFECFDVIRNKPVAVKLLKHGFERDADFECDVLKAVTRADTADSYGVVKIVERFEWNGHAAIVFNLKGKPLRSKKTALSNKDIAVVAKDVAAALDFLHFTVKAVHTDLKPENILEELSPNRLNRSWSICDLGSASFYSAKLDTDLITTRPYRAPEVLLNLGWSYAADTWSLGCILYELKTGRRLFEAHNDADHLLSMEMKLGRMPWKWGRTPNLGFGGRQAVSIQDEFKSEPDFCNLLLSLLQFEPTQRLRCGDVLSHAFVTKSIEEQQATTSYSTQMLPLGTRLTPNVGFMHVGGSAESSPRSAQSSLGARTADSKENSPQTQKMRFNLGLDRQTSSQSGGTSSYVTSLKGSTSYLSDLYASSRPTPSTYSTSLYAPTNLQSGVASNPMNRRPLISPVPSSLGSLRMY